MKLSTKIMSIVTAAVLLFSFAMFTGLPDIFKVKADDDPTMPENAVVTFDETGKEHQFGNAFTWLKDRMWVKIAAPVNLADVEMIEFDLYIGSIEPVLSAMKTNGSNMYFSFSSNDREQNRVAQIINSQIKKDGWNHISFFKEGYSTAATWEPDVWCLYFDGGVLENSTGSIVKDIDVKIKNICGTTNSDWPEMPENADIVIDEAGKVKPIGGQFGYLQDELFKGFTAVDLTTFDFLEFDIFISDHQALKTKMSSAGVNLYFCFGAGANRFSGRQKAPIIAQIKNDGWNHIKIVKEFFVGTGAGELNWSEVNWWGLCFDGATTTAPGNPLQSYRIKVMNVCTTIDKPDLSENYEVLISETGKATSLIGPTTTSSTAAYSHLQDRSPLKLAQSIDLSRVDNIEFDIYISDLDLLLEEFGNSGINTFKFTMNSHDTDIFSERSMSNILPQLENSGWNHIKVTRQSFAWMGYNGQTDWTNICRFSILIDQNSSANPGAARDVIFKIVNVVGTMDYVPPLDYTPAVLIDETGAKNTIGNEWNWLQDRLIKTLTEPVDLSNVDYIEFDIFISDVDLLVQEMDGVEILLQFTLSSSETIKTANRFGVEILSKLQTGWNHIKLKKSDFKAMGAGDLDWSSVYRWALSYTGASSEVTKNPSAEAKGIIFRVVNVTGTIKPILVQPDVGDKPVKPDTSAHYISDCESIIGALGSWNPNTATVDTSYKTEAKASVSNIFKDQLIKTNSLRFLLNDNLNLSGATAIKFDFFVDDIELLQMKATLTFNISSDSRAANHFLTWKIDTADLEAGWNSLTFNMSDGVKSIGSVDLTAIRNLFVQCETAEFGINDDGEDEEVQVKIDNLRYLGTAIANPIIPDDGDEIPDETEGDEKVNPDTSDLQSILWGGVFIAGLGLAFVFGSKKTRYFRGK